MTRTRKMHVLIVDDDPLTRLMASEALREGGYTSVEAEDGLRALALFDAERPDLVLLDVMMPKKSGYEVCEALRADPAQAALKIVMLTAKGRDTEVAKGLAIGADVYMTKPFSTKELMLRVRETLGQA